LNFKEKIEFADNMELYAHGVIVALSEKMGPEAACIRVMQHLSLVLQAGWEATPPEEFALVLLPRGYVSRRSEYHTSVDEAPPVSASMLGWWRRKRKGAAIAA